MLNTTLRLLVGAMLLYSCLSISQDTVVLSASLPLGRLPPPQFFSASLTLGRLPPPQFFLAPWLHLRGGAGSRRTGRTPSSSEKKEEEEESSSSTTPEGPQSACSKGNVEEFEPEESSDETGRIQMAGSEREQRRELEIQRLREGRKKASSR
jgi:hypothetical protein